MEERLNSLRDLFVDEIADLLSAENQLVAALPKMAQAAYNQDLKEAFEGHLKETREQAERLKQIFQLIGEPVRANTCKAMRGLIEEADEMIGKGGEQAVMDAAIIACAQRVEHYEIAAYGCAKTYAKLLGYDEAESLLKETLEEEAGADKKLNKLAEGSINEDALEATGSVR